MRATALLPKLLRLAFDPGAAEGEAVNAAAAAVKHARRFSIDYAGVCELIGPSHQLPPTMPQQPAAVHVLMPFGKHRGLTLGEIAQRDIKYLTWAIANLEDQDELVAAMRTTLEWLGGRGGE